MNQAFRAFKCLILVLTCLPVTGQNLNEIDSLKALLDKTMSDSAKVEILNSIADEYNNSDSGNTAAYINRSIEIARRAGYFRGISDAYYLIAWSNIRLGNFPLAADLCDKAFLIADSVNYLRGQSRALNGLGVIQRRLGNYKKALEFQFQSLDIKEQTKDYQGMAATYNNIGFIYDAQEDYDAADKYFQKALQLKEEFNISRGLAENYNNIGNVNYARGKTDLAQQYFRKALKIHSEEQNRNGISSSFNNIGKTYLKEGYLDSAEYYVQKSHLIAKEIENKSKIALTSLILAETYLASGEVGRSFPYIEKGYDISTQIMDPFIEGYALELYADYNYRTGDYRKAYLRQGQYIALLDSLKRDEKSQQMARLQAEYDFQKEKDSLKLSREREQIAYSAEINRRRFIQRGTYIGLGLTLVILFMILYNYRMKKRVNKKLTELNREVQFQNIEIKSQRDHLEETLDQLKRTQAHLLEAEKMASLGTLTAGVAHEINNPLNFIKGAYVALSRYFRESGDKDSYDVQELLESINAGVERTSAIVKGLSLFSRDSKEYSEKCEINSIINNCLIILNNQVPFNVGIEKDYMMEEIYVLGNVGKLHQVFINVLTNAIQSITDAGQITIRTSISNNLAVIQIKDTGTGISEKNLDRISEPFFTTKEPGRGTGLGLSITYKIIKEHQGTISFDSRVGEGTAVTIQLPLEAKVFSTT